MVEGFVINKTERSKHIFKMSVTPGMKVPIQSWYEVYKNKYKGKLDLKFVEWLEDNKVPKSDDWELVVNSHTVEKDPTEELLKEETTKPIVDERPITKIKPINKITAAELSELKHKDQPKKTIQQVMSIHKLRRALNLCKGKAGKTLIIKYLRERIDEIK